MYLRIFSHSITGNLLITDTKEFINKFPIVGQERLTMKIKTPSPEIKKKIYLKVRYLISLNVGL